MRLPISGLGRNRGACAYTTPRGTFLSSKSVRDIVDEHVDATAARMLSHGAPLKVSARQFLDGKIDKATYDAAVKDWVHAGAATLKGAHVGAGISACGGVRNTTQSRYGLMGSELKAQYAYLRNAGAEFADNPEIVLGIAPGRRTMDERSVFFAEGVRGTFNKLEFAENEANGAQSVANVLEDGAHHCEGDASCPAMTRLGRVSIRDVRWIVQGFRRCKNRCKCRAKYYKAKAPEVVG